VRRSLALKTASDGEIEGSKLIAVSSGGQIHRRTLRTPLTRTVVVSEAGCGLIACHYGYRSGFYALFRKKLVCLNISLYTMRQFYTSQEYSSKSNHN